MSRTTKTITISLSSEMAEQIEQVIKEEGRTKSEFLREAIRRYMEDREWKRLLRYGEQKAREHGIAPDDVERIIDEYRAELQQNR